VATIAVAPGVSDAARPYPAGSRRFDLAVAGLSTVMVGGVYLDGWAHTHLPGMETFFTPWHAVLYSGYALVAGFLGWCWFENLRRGRAWNRALPVGYSLSMVGSLIFAAGGYGDMLWHGAFGIETGVDALLSPTHLLLALGGALIVSGPLRAAWQRPAAGSGAGAAWSHLLPMLLSLTLTLSVLTFMTEYAHPFVHRFGSRLTGGGSVAQQALGVVSIILQTALAMGLLLYALRRCRLPFGGLMLLFGLNAAAMAVFEDTYDLVAVALLAGLAADGLLWLLRPSVDRPVAFRIFAVATPIAWWGLYFLALQAGGGIRWTVHLWTGAVAIAGITGLLLSLLVLSPAPVPAGERDEVGP
jgi:hypothetical protein